MKLHASGEDYLETILVLQKKRGMVRSVDVARHMEVSKPSVCHAVATLRDGGFLTIDNGQIAQQGTHEELLKQPGIYQEFVNIRKNAAGCFTETLLFSASCSCVIFIAFRTAFICFPKAIASAFGIIITSIVLYRSCGKNGITSSFQ